MEATGCATAAAICTCAPAQNPCGRPQVLPAYGLQDLRNEYRDPKTKSNPNTMCLQITPGEDHGSGHFYLAKNRTFLLCVDIQPSPCPEHSRAFPLCVGYTSRQSIHVPHRQIEHPGCLRALPHR